MLVISLVFIWSPKSPSCLHSAAVFIRQVAACFFQCDQLIKVVWKKLLLEFKAWDVIRLAHKVFFCPTF